MRNTVRVGNRWDFNTPFGNLFPCVICGQDLYLSESHLVSGIWFFCLHLFLGKPDVWTGCRQCVWFQWRSHSLFFLPNTFNFSDSFQRSGWVFITALSSWKGFPLKSALGCKLRVIYTSHKSTLATVLPPFYRCSIIVLNPGKEQQR